MGANPGKPQHNCSEDNSWEYLCSDFPDRKTTVSCFPDFKSSTQSLPLSNFTRSDSGVMNGTSSRYSSMENRQNDESSSGSSDAYSESPPDMSSDIESSQTGGMNFGNIQFKSQSASFGNTYAFNGSCPPSLEDSIYINVNGKHILDCMKGKLKSYWKQRQNSYLQISSSTTVGIRECPVININNGDNQNFITLGGEFTTALLEGFQGSGKTVHVQQMALNWAYGHEYTDFDLLFILNQLNFKGPILEALAEQASVDDTNPEIIKKVIKENQKNIIIIIDAFDLLTAEASDEVKKLLERSVLPMSNVVVTSRPEKCTNVRDLFHRHFMALPLGKAKIETFFNAYGENVKEKVLQMLGSDCKDMLTCPLFLHVLCVMADTEPRLRVNHNVTDLYKMFVESVMKRKYPEADWQDVFVEFGKLCCTSGLFKYFSNMSVDKLKYKEVVLGLDLIVKSGENIQFYHSKQRSFTDFAMALYLSKMVEVSSFNRRLKSILKESDQSELFLRFLVGFVPKYIDKIFHLLPRYLTQSWNLDLVNILGESGVLIRESSFIKEMPDCIQLKFKKVLYTSEENDFVVINSNIDPGFYSSRCPCKQIKKHLLGLLELENCPIIRIELEVDEYLTGAEFIMELLTKCAQVGRIDYVKLNCHKITKKICDVIVFIMENIRNVEIQMISSSHFNLLPMFLLGKLSNPKLEFLEIFTESSEWSMERSDVTKLCQVLTQCKRLIGLKLQPVSNEWQSFNEILSLNLKNVTIISYHRRKLSGGVKKSSSVGCIPYTADIFRVLKKVAESKVEYIDVSGLYVDVDDPRLVNTAVGLISSRECHLRELKLVHCLTLKGSLPCVDLSLLAPAQRKWDSLDLSGWKITADGGTGECGSIKKLVASNSEYYNLCDFLEKFKVEEIVCDDDRLKDFRFQSSNFPHLVGMSVKFCDARENVGDFCECLERLSSLSALTLEFDCSDLMKCDLDFNSVIVKLKNLKFIHLVLKFDNWTNALRTIKGTLSIPVDKIELTLDNINNGEVVWSDFFCYVYEALHNNCKIIKVSQKTSNYIEFLKSFEKWEIDNYLKLQKYSTNNKMTSIELCK